MADLHSRVRGALEDDQGTEGLFGSPASAAVRDDAEANIQAWGYVYGLAYAIAKAEDPYEPASEVGARARAVALPIYAEYVGDLVAEGQVP
jgi:hypothetical protein